MDLVVSITIPIFALLIAYLAYEALQQAKTIRELRASVGALEKDLHARRAKEAADAAAIADVTEISPPPKPKRARKK